MRTNTKKFKVLEFIGRHTGVRYSEIERFVCELSGFNYDEMISAWVWDSKSQDSKLCKVRRHKGIWGTNLCSGNSSILKGYCEKNSDGRWMLDEVTADFIREYFNQRGNYGTIYDIEYQGPEMIIIPKPVSSLEVPPPSDEIKGNSVPISVTRIQVPVGVGPIIPPKTMTLDEMSNDQLAIEAVKLLKEVRACKERAKKAFYDASATLSQANKDVKEAEALVRKALWL